MASKAICIVPFCPRKSGRFPGHSRFICGEHWTASPKRLRVLVKAAERRWKRDRSAENLEACNRLWDLLERKILERAAGIG